MPPNIGFCRRATTYLGGAVHLSQCRLPIPDAPQPIPVPSTYPADVTGVRPLEEPYRPALLAPDTTAVKENPADGSFGRSRCAAGRRSRQPDLPRVPHPVSSPIFWSDELLKSLQ